jgi:hypothetical protein
MHLDFLEDHNFDNLEDLKILDILVNLDHLEYHLLNLVDL